MTIDRQARTGFSLVELLIVATIFALASGAVIATLSAGINVWHRARSADRALVDALIGYDLFERDLLNAYRFYGSPVLGDPRRLRFPGESRDDRDGAVSSPLATISYHFDPGSRGLYRKIWRYPEAEPTDSSAERIMNEVHDIALSYYMESLSRPGEYAWEKTYGDASRRLLGVRMSIILVDADEESDDQEEITRTVYLQRL